MAAVAAAASDPVLDSVLSILQRDYYRPLSAREVSSTSTEELFTYLDDPHTFIMTNQEYEEFLGTVEGDWVLIYKLEGNKLTLLLSETGTHADLFT